MLSEGIRPIGDGLLEVAPERLQGLLVTEDINEIYDVEQTPFARGKFAAVRRAVHKKTGVHFAAKFLRRRRRAQCTLREIGHEIAILMLCADSKHIVKLNAVHETKLETALILELATGGELQAILDEEGAFTEQQAQSCMREILKALQYLHKKYIAHLDLKPQNILLCGEKVEDGLKLCDFGISRIVEEGGKVREILGTPDYVAPEVLQYEPLSLKTDIWSVGVLTYVLLTGCSPFGGDTKQETFLNISKCSLTFPDELFEEVSPIAIDFIRCALRVKPHERMTATECLEHRWLNDETPLRMSITTNNQFTTDCNDFLDHNCTATSGVGDSPHNNTTTIASNNHHTTTINNISCNTNGVVNTHLSQSVEEKSDTHNRDQTNSTTTMNTTKLEQTNHHQDYNKENILANSNNSQYLSNGLLAQSTNVPPPPPPTSSQSNDINGKHSQQSTPMSLFPDAPTTPKVCRKSSPDSPPSVKALVKKFQLDNSTVTTTINSIIEDPSQQLIDDDDDQNNVEYNGVETDGIVVIEQNDFISTTVRCCASSATSAQTVTTTVNAAAAGPGCRHLNGRKSIGLDQGIIC